MRILIISLIRLKITEDFTHAHTKLKGVSSQQPPPFYQTTITTLNNRHNTVFILLFRLLMVVIVVFKRVGRGLCSRQRLIVPVEPHVAVFLAPVAGPGSHFAMTQQMPGFVDALP